MIFRLIKLTIVTSTPPCAVASAIIPGNQCIYIHMHDVICGPCEVCISKNAHTSDIIFTNVLLCMYTHTYIHVLTVSTHADPNVMSKYIINLIMPNCFK